MTSSKFTSVAPVYPVDDVETAVDWYQRLLGFTVVHLSDDPAGHAPTNYAVLKRDGVWLHLIRRAEASEGFDGYGSAQFTVVDGLEDLFTSLQSNGVKILQPPEEQPSGRRDFIVADQDGNKLRISQSKTMPRKARTMGEQRKALGCVIYDMLMVASAVRQLQKPPPKYNDLRFGDEQVAFEGAMLKCRALFDFLCLPPQINKHDIIITDLGGTPLTLSKTERHFRTSVNQWCAHLDWQRVERKPARSSRPTVAQTITQGKSVLAKANAFVEGRLTNGFRLTIYGGRYWKAFKEVWEGIK